MTTITISIDGKQVEAEQNSTLLSVFKEHDILINQICGGQGMCASCHFFVMDGAEALTQIGRASCRERVLMPV